MSIDSIDGRSTTVFDSLSFDYFIDEEEKPQVKPTPKMSCPSSIFIIVPHV